MRNIFSPSLQSVYSRMIDADGVPSACCVIAAEVWCEGTSELSDDCSLIVCWRLRLRLGFRTTVATHTDMVSLANTRLNEVIQVVCKMVMQNHAGTGPCGDKAMWIQKPVSICKLSGTNKSVINFIYQINKITHTHNRFTALLEFVWDHPGEQVPERLNQEG